MPRSTNWASRTSLRYMEILGLEPKTTICKIAVLPFKLYPLFILVEYNPVYSLNITFQYLGWNLLYIRLIGFT